MSNVKDEYFNDTNDICPRNCEYLSITEEKQEELGKSIPHICTKYDVRLYHMLAHPDLYKCEQCYKENKNDIY